MTKEALIRLMARRWAEGRDIRTGRPLEGRDRREWERITSHEGDRTYDAA